ncbi:MAG: hypothetical protein FRX48_04320 [Lasallia pustulata]|uniref:Uncharacterized protein n=1 Tax=Lasallia pustulata TaxID=136370 RepID=A0A5M8PRL4_9LECA|nr:MAG: hypothetical protein FRX48_04320 [Lasallia pustulata]
MTAVAWSSNFGAYRDSPSPVEVYAFLAKYKARRHAEPPPSLPLPVSIELICFHKKIIRYFAKHFASSLLAVHPLSRDSALCYVPPSSTETRRIHRALYRFELYYRLFAGSRWEAAEWLGFPAPTINFLSLYPPWEVEELHCVHDFLYRRFLVAYIDVAQHDVRMGNFGMHSGPLKAEQLGTFDHQIEHCLSLGLTYVHEAMTSPGLEDRIELNPAGLSYKYFPGVVLRYYKTLRMTSHAEGNQTANFLGGSLSNRPNEAWVWWKRLLYPDTCDSQDSLVELRKWGYCMWDSDRLRDWEVLREEYDVAYFEKKFCENSAELGRKWTEAMWTEACRAQVWLKGGSGYWTADESRIVWSGEPREDSRSDTVVHEGRNMDLVFAFHGGDLDF